MAFEISEDELYIKFQATGSKIGEKFLNTYLTLYIKINPMYIKV